MKKEEAIEVIKKLKKTYPDATCSLNFNTPFELGIAVMLSAQCTDERVNKTTPALFAKYKTPEDYLKASVEDIEQIIKPCGFYKNKTKNLLGYAKMVIENYNGELPKSMDELVKLPGIGRKSANVIMLEAFNNPKGIAIDTHAKRIATRVGFSNKKEPSKIEEDLIKLIPSKYFKDVNHLLVWHGRKTCDARKPKCENCTIRSYCKYFNSKK